MFFVITKKTPRVEDWSLSVIVKEDVNVMVPFFRNLGTSEFMDFWEHCNEEEFECKNVRFRLSGKAFGIKGLKDGGEMTKGPIVRFKRGYIDDYETYMPELVLEAFFEDGHSVFLHDTDASEIMKRVRQTSDFPLLWDDN